MPGRNDDRTPVVPHARPQVISRAGDTPRGPPPLPGRTGTPAGGTLAPLGRVPVPGPEVFVTDEPPTTNRTTAAIAARLVRNWAACSVADQRLIEALALRLRSGVG